MHLLIVQLHIYMLSSASSSQQVLLELLRHGLPGLSLHYQVVHGEYVEAARRHELRGVAAIRQLQQVTGVQHVDHRRQAALTALPELIQHEMVGQTQHLAREGRHVLVGRAPRRHNHARRRVGFRVAVPALGYVLPCVVSRLPTENPQRFDLTGVEVPAPSIRISIGISKRSKSVSQNVVSVSQNVVNLSPSRVLIS
jgi:hypothetical protein